MIQDPMTSEDRFANDEVFPRPCKNCGNPVMVHNGKLVHVYRKSVRCRTFRRWDLERDASGQVKAMHWMGDVPIPDPPSKEQADADRLAEWDQIYGKSCGATTEPS